MWLVQTTVRTGVCVFMSHTIQQHQLDTPGLTGQMKTNVSKYVHHISRWATTKLPDIDITDVIDL